MSLYLIVGTASDADAYACAVHHLDNGRAIAHAHPADPRAFPALASNLAHARDHLTDLIAADWQFPTAKRLSELRTLATDWLNGISDDDIRTLAVADGFPAIYAVTGNGKPLVSTSSLRWWLNPGYAPSTEGKDNALKAARKRFARDYPDLAQAYDGTPFVA